MSDVLSLICLLAIAKSAATEVVAEVAAAVTVLDVGPVKLLALAVNVLVTRLPNAVDLMVLFAALSAESVATPPVIMMLPVVVLVTEVPASRLCSEAKPKLAWLMLVADMPRALLALLPLPVALKVLPLNVRLLVPIVLVATFR